VARTGVEIVVAIENDVFRASMRPTPMSVTFSRNLSFCANGPLPGAVEWPGQPVKGRADIDLAMMRCGSSASGCRSGGDQQDGGEHHAVDPAAHHSVVRPLIRNSTISVPTSALATEPFAAEADAAQHGLPSGRSPPARRDIAADGAEPCGGKTPRRSRSAPRCGVATTRLYAAPECLNYSGERREPRSLTCHPAANE